MAELLRGRWNAARRLELYSEKSGKVRFEIDALSIPAPPCEIEDIQEEPVNVTTQPVRVASDERLRIEAKPEGIEEVVSEPEPGDGGASEVPEEEEETEKEPEGS